MPRLSREFRYLPAVLLLVLWSPDFGQAQFHRATDPVATPPASIMGQDDALAIDVNPAAIGLLPSWNLAYLHSEADDQEIWLGTGDAFFAVAPLFRGLAAGLSLQSIRSGSADLRPDLGRVGRGMGALALAYGRSSYFSLGGTARVLTSGNADIDGLATTDLGALWRPAAWLGISLVGRDLLASREGQGTGRLALGPSGVLSLILRPLGTRDIALELAAALDHNSRVGGRGGVVVTVPYFGSASALAEIEHLGDRDSSLKVIGGLTVHWGRAVASGGALLPRDFDGDPGWYALVGLEGAARPGIPIPRSVLEVEISRSSPRDMVGLTLLLESVLYDRRVAGVVLRPRGSGMGMAYAQELRRMIAMLRNAGKPVLCHLDSASGAEYYACAAADRVLIDPAGHLRLMGTGLRVVLLGETLRKIGVRADFVRIGPYKSAPEQLEHGALSQPAREQTDQLVDDVYRRLLTDLSADLRFSSKRLTNIVNSGPHLAPQALKHRLVGGIGDEFDLDGAVRDTVGNFSIKTELTRTAPQRWSAGPRIGVVLVDGTIIDGKSIDIPLLDIHFSGGRTVAETLQSLAADPSIAAIVVRVDSPGGAVVASDQIWRAVRRARRRKPVIASMGAVAASGGYYIASAASEIWADPSTVTGSIGIYYGKVDIQKLASMIGVNVEFFQRGRFASADSIWRPYTPEERAVLAERVRSYYRLFLQRVSSARGIPAGKLDRLARGRVYSGDRAVKEGLVDHLGGLAAALSRARELADVRPDTAVVLMPERKLDLLSCVVQQALGAAGSNDNAGDDDAIVPSRALPLPVPSEITSTLSLMTSLHLIGSGKPLAIMPHVIEIDL